MGVGVGGGFLFQQVKWKSRWVGFRYCWGGGGGDEVEWQAPFTCAGEETLTVFRIFTVMSTGYLGYV